MKKLLFSIFALLLFACKSPDPRRPVFETSGTFIDQSVERSKKLVQHEEKLIKEIIEDDTANNYLTSNYGFWYYYNEQINEPAERPKFGDKVVFDYNIRHLDGSPIYASEEISPKTYVMDKEDLITGLREGLKLMKEGETITFLLPSYTAFGYYGDNNKIGINTPLKSTVTLKSIEKQNGTKSDTLN